MKDFAFVFQNSTVAKEKAEIQEKENKYILDGELINSESANKANSRAQRSPNRWDSTGR